MIKEIDEIKDRVRNNPELEIVVKQGLTLIIKKINEFEDNSKKWNNKK